MKKYVIYFCSLMVLSVSIQSCSEYLEEANPNLVSADIFWSTLEESNTNLTSVYGAMLNQYVINTEYEGYNSDLGFPKSRITLDKNGSPWYLKEISETSSQLSQIWDAHYQVIFRANQIIEGLNGMSDDLKSDPRWTEQMAQARFFRGLIHFYLHSSFNEGKIIIRDFVSGNPSEFYIPVSSSEEVLTFFREDLKYAYDNLPAKFDDKTRVTKGTAATVLGKSFLYTEEYDNAILYLSEVINNAEYGYQLLQGTDVTKLYTHAGDYNSESILEINYANNQQIEDEIWDEESFFTRLARHEGPQQGGIGRGNAWLVPTAWLTYAYSTEPLDTQDSRNYVPDGNGGIRLRSVSLRCAQSIEVVNDEESTYYEQTPANSYFNFSGTTFSYFKFHTNHDITDSEDNILLINWKSGKNVIVYTLSQVHLMLAECQLKTGKINEALENVNKVRQRWGLVSLGISDGSAHDFDNVSYTPETLMHQLMYVDYPLEVAILGHAERKTDLRRWGITKARYQELASTDFNLVNYTTLDGLGKPKSLIKLGPSADLSDQTISIKEFEQAAQVYTESLFDYYPLPLSEVINNPAVNN